MIETDYIEGNSILDISFGDVAKRVELLGPKTPIIDCFILFMRDEKLSLIMEEPPGMAEKVCRVLIEKFNELLPLFHDEDFIKGYYKSKNIKRGGRSSLPPFSIMCYFKHRKKKD